MRSICKILFYLLLPVLSVQSTNAQITVATTDATSCKKADGKATITVTTTATGFDFEYSVDGGAYQASNSFEKLAGGAHSASVRDKNTQCAFSKSFIINEATNKLVLGITGLGTTEFCNNAKPPTVTLTATASGGSGKYDFTWPGGTITVSSSGRQSVTATDTETGCKESLGGDVIFVPIVCSRDPNDIIGPEGHNPGKMIAKSKRHSYMIRFENDPDFATAPAQVVKINHPLDTNVNPFTLRLSDFGFAGMNFTVPADKTFYSARLNVIDSLGVVVDVTAGIDAVKKEAFWVFESKDPATGLPPVNSHLGFLPVNDSSARGEGFVTYTIKAANRTVTGDTIHAKASIVFDINASIETPVIYNTIDAVAPVSEVNSLPASTDSTTIQLSWAGKDDVKGSGVRDYDLYVSENDGSFTVYQSGITDTATSFTGTAGKTYSFYTIATDNVGNREELKTRGEVTIKFNPDIVLPVTWLYFKGQQISKDVLLTWATVFEKNTKSFVIERSLNGRQFAEIGRINAAGNSYQTNNYQYTDFDITSLAGKVVYYRLKQIDIDGTFSYSIVVSFTISSIGSAPVVKAYPNPFTNFITLQVLNVTDNDETDNVSLYSIEGKMIYHCKVVKRGNATILLDDLPNIKSGSYILRTTISGKQYLIKMLRQ